MRTLKEMTRHVIDESYQANNDFKNSSKAEYIKLWKRKERKKLGNGFPVTEPLNFEQAKEYSLLSNKTYCLLCGWEGKALCAHVAKAHGIKPVDYKLAYQLPLGSSLVCESTFKKLHDNAINNKPLIEARELCKEDNKVKRIEGIKKAMAERVGLKTFHQETSKINVKKAPKVKPTYYKEDFDTILRLMTDNDMSMSEVANNFDVMKPTCFRRFLKDELNNLNYISTLDDLTFKAQARGSFLGDRFRLEATKKYKELENYRLVGEFFGVSEMTAYRNINNIKR